MTEFVHFKTESPSNPANQFLLNDPDNYFESFREITVQCILEKYSALIFEYWLFFFDKIKCNKKKQIYFKYIFERGFDTVTSVFMGVLLNTRNIELSLYHAQKSLYFYIEFIEQISDAQNSFLQLSSRDAVMFVYKRTIFEINRDMIKVLSNPNSSTLIKTIVDTYSALLKEYAMFFARGFVNANVIENASENASENAVVPNIHEFVSCTKELFDEIVKRSNHTTLHTSLHTTFETTLNTAHETTLNTAHETTLNAAHETTIHNNLESIAETLRPILRDTKLVPLSMFWEKNNRIVKQY